ncbi:ATP-binding protein [Streptomyces zingiberis]|uniref:ATP-binding protein n=1 Tax=Streptomyces zingiberis TaxID=2053010 RepID=A0ABX1BMU9_9ACTN|nr:ATP-binding protein [Streptomyces zingiberis]NJP99056.1 ATP-binding protein [Streptomyces zingiberis]
MATVELLFSPLPNHVRTARLVAAAVARRAGVDEAVMDEVRLAVGEACSRAVGLHLSNNVSAPVRVSLTEDEKKFSIEVADEVPHRPTHLQRSDGDADAMALGEAVAEEDDEMGLAVISGLVDEVEVTADGTGGRIRMSWPTAPDALLP